MPKDFQWLADRWMVHYGGVCELRYHFVWCPKYRRKVLVDNVAQRLQELLHEAVEQLGGKVLELAIQPDHLHLFVQMGTPLCRQLKLPFILRVIPAAPCARSFPNCAAACQLFGAVLPMLAQLGRLAKKPWNDTSPRSEVDNP